MVHFCINYQIYNIQLFQNCQMQTTSSQKKKYLMNDYLSLNRANPIIKDFNQQYFKLSCLCGQTDQNGFKCFRCNAFVHACLAPRPNRGEMYQCFSCLNKFLDPLIQVRKILVQSCFKTVPIFEYINIFNFEFDLLQEDLGFPVQVRGLMPDNTSLVWPMQGAFYVNDEKNSIHELKPLLFNSNRKHRREQYFHIPSDRLKAGRNFVRFKIPCLDKATFATKFQHQDKKIYYIAVNSVQRLTPADLQTQTFRERRIEKGESLRILKSNNAEIEVISNKVCLICPYTRERIKVPVRGKYCKHFSCICLQTLIASHSNSRYWGCPICQLKINEPYVDVWIYNMLKDNQQGSDVTVKDDGTYEWIKSQQSMAMNLDSDDDSPSMKVQLPLPKQKQVKQVKAQMVPQPKQQIQPEIPPTKKKDSFQQMNFISIDDDDDELASKKQTQSKRQVLKKRLKQKMKPQNQQASKATKNDEIGTKDPIEQSRKKEDRSRQKERSPFVSDIKTLQTKQMKWQDFKKQYFKPRINPYKKMVQTQEFKRLFKQIF